MLGDENTLYADVAYNSTHTSYKLKRLGINNKIQRKGYRNNTLAKEDKVYNAYIAVTRTGGERPFATYKQHCSLTRTKFLGFTKNITFYGLAAIAWIIRKGAKFLTNCDLSEVINAEYFHLHFEK